MQHHSEKGIAIQSYLIDVFFIWYVLISLDRIIIPALITYIPLHGFIIQVGYLAIAGISSYIVRRFEQSAGMFILSDTHHAMPLFGKHLMWLAFSCSIIAGWIITDISPIDFSQPKDCNLLLIFLLH